MGMLNLQTSKNSPFFGPPCIYIYIYIYICDCVRATGHHEYGPKYHEQIIECVRRSAEHCDCLQCFFILHSMGGGTLYVN